MNVKICLIYRCLSSASAVIGSWFICELQKSTTIVFSRKSLYTFYSRIPTCEIPSYLRISNHKYPMPSEFHNRDPPSPSEILKAVRGISRYRNFLELSINAKSFKNKMLHQQFITIQTLVFDHQISDERSTHARRYVLGT